LNNRHKTKTDTEKLKLLVGWAGQVCSSVVVRRTVLRSSP